MAVVNPKGEGPDILAPFINSGHIRLVTVAEERNGAGVGAVKPEIPHVRVEVPQGDARITLEHVMALLQDELSDARKVRLEHQIRGGFGEARHGAEALQERDERLVARQGIVAQIELKVVKRLIFRRARAGEDDPHPRNAARGDLPDPPPGTRRWFHPAS